jgi:hypothetical protein
MVDFLNPLVEKTLLRPPPPPPPPLWDGEDCASIAALNFANDIYVFAFEKK